MKRKISLTEWDNLHFEKAHSISTLRKWARDGFINPAPEKVGREYMVQPDAIYCPPNRDRLAKLRQAERMTQGDPAIANDLDPTVLRILNNGSCAA